MQDIFSMLNQLRRPRLLIQAARAGCDEYRREAHLRRLLGHGDLPKSGEALLRLIEMEVDLNQQRREGAGGYCLIAHVDVLIAMMGEARLARAYMGSHETIRVV